MKYINRGVKFTESYFMKDMVELCTQKRQQAAKENNQTREKMNKGIVYSSCGKICDDVRNRQGLSSKRR